MRGSAWRAGGGTHVAAVIGSPVRHSLSPVIHNAAFAALDLDWAYVAFEVEAGAGARAVDAMRVLGLRGLSVTMPHKADVAGAVDRLTRTAEALGAVNTVAWGPRLTLVGDNTDGPGFIDAVRVDEGFDPVGRRALVRGAAAANGLGMLIHQAAHAFRLWTGEEPPLEVMSAAALAELGPRPSP